MTFQRKINICINVCNHISDATSLHLERFKRQLSSEELLNLSPEELCKDRLSEEYFRLTTEGDCRDVVRYAYNCDLKSGEKKNAIWGSCKG